MGALVVLAVMGRMSLSMLFGGPHRERKGGKELEPPSEPRSVIRILRSDFELSEALRKAAQFERSAANDRRRRADRYEALITPALFAEFPAAEAGPPPWPAA